MSDEADLGAAEGLQVWLPFFWGAQAEPVQARLVNYYSRAELGGASDLAVLELTEEPPCRTISVPELPSFLVDQPNLGDRLWVTGFPESSDDLKSKADHSYCEAGLQTELGWITIRSMEFRGAVKFGRALAARQCGASRGEGLSASYVRQIGRGAPES